MQGTKLSRIFLIVLITAAALPWQRAGLFAAPQPQITVLFTHDLHARIESFSLPGGKTVGGFARLSALAAKERNKNPGGTLRWTPAISAAERFLTPSWGRKRRSSTPWR